MTQTTQADDSSRWQHHDQLHRRCRIPRVSTHPSFCYFHARQEREFIGVERSAEDLASISGSFRTTDVNHVLGRVFKLLADKRISPREAATFAYLGQLLLQSMHGVQHEFDVAHGRDCYHALRELLRGVVPPRSTSPAPSPSCSAAPPTSAPPPHAASQSAAVRPPAPKSPNLPPIASASSDPRVR